jgi:hypothetical protein
VDGTIDESEVDRTRAGRQVAGEGGSTAELPRRRNSDAWSIMLSCSVRPNSSPSRRCASVLIDLLFRLCQAPVQLALPDQCVHASSRPAAMPGAAVLAIQSARSLALCPVG